MSDESSKKVVKRSEERAKRFVEEFGAPFDPGQNDWDKMVWEEDKRYLGLTEVECNETWPIYLNTLILETARLCGI